MAPVARERLGASEVEFTGGQVRAAKGRASMEFDALARECYLANVHLAASGFFRTPPTSWDAATGQGDAYVAYSWAADIAEVEVDAETGEVRVVSVVAAHDVGRAINPAGVEGQIEGGAVQGMGYAAMEDLVSKDGVIQNPGLSDYLIPTSMDAPRVTPIIVEHPYPEGPYGAKGIGEPSLMAAPAAVTNAIANAIGRRVNHLPVTQERVFEALRAARKG
jgi:CO/xanthine dehydrogenase Mo-binding subunit